MVFFSHDNGSAPASRWGLRPQIPTIGLRSALAMSPPLLRGSLRGWLTLDQETIIEWGQHRRIHSNPRKVTSRRRCGLLPNYFGHLLLFNYIMPHSSDSER